MKMILSSRRHHYVARASIFLVTVALIAGMVGCTTFPLSYSLTIASTAGGSTTPGAGTSTYAAGTVVDLVATPDAGYRFVNWAGNVGTIANVNAASATITMNGDYSITANFVRRYNLTIASIAGGSVTVPGEGTFTYDAGTVVNLVATPASGYRFVNWTGNVGTVGTVNAATTTITMNGDYTVSVIFIPTPPPYPVSISNIVATPTKIGNAAVITWNTDVPTTNNIVIYDQSSPPSTTSSPGSANVYNHAVVISGLTPTSTYYYRVRVTYLGTEYVSSVNTFIARNARNAWDSSVNQYTVNMLVTLTWDVTSTSDTFLTTWFTSTNSYMAQAAQDIYDATDGYIRLGTVIVVDNQQKGNALWQTSDMTFEDKDDPDTSDLDERYQSTGGITPYTYNASTNKWLHTPGIENSTGGVGMQFGKIGATYNQDWSSDSARNGSYYQSGWQARIITHEFGHYALYLPDRYDLNSTTGVYSYWDQNSTYDSDLMSQLGYWVNSNTFNYYTEFGARNSYQTGYSDPFGEGNPYDQPPLPVNYSSWFLIIIPDPIAGSGTLHYSNAYGGVEPDLPNAGPTTGNGGVFSVIFINN